MTLNHAHAQCGMDPESEVIRVQSLKLLKSSFINMINRARHFIFPRKKIYIKYIQSHNMNFELCNWDGDILTRYDPVHILAHNLCFIRR